MAKKKRKNKDIVFRRIRGRIVPIKRRKGTGTKSRERGNNLVKGTALLGGATAVATGTGFISGKLFQSATKTGQESINMTRTAAVAFNLEHGGTPEGRRAQAALIRGAARRAKSAERKLKASQRTIKFGTNALVAAIAGEGIEKIASGLLGRELNLGEEVASNVGGFALTVGAQKSFKKGFSSPLGRKGIKKLLKKVLSKGRL